MQLAAVLPALLLLALPAAAEPLRVGILGLTHGHASGFLRTAVKRADLNIVGISEPDAALRERYAKQFNIPAEKFFPTHQALLEQAKPEAVMIFTSTFEHKELVEMCAARKVHAMMEKPLAVSTAHARAMAAAAKKSGIHVLVNYETTWYPVNAPIWSMVKTEKRLGEVRRIVTHYGHQGPKEIRVGPEFLGWLTDPVKNGAGALFDFGCYGANFATWLFDNQRPLSVTAVTHTNKPDIYAKVDDEATVIIQYEKAQVVVEPSWNWTFGRKDMAIYGTAGLLVTSNPRDYRVRLAENKPEEAMVAPPLAAPDNDVVSYLTAVVRGERKPDGLSGLENNLIVTEILEAAKESARTGRTVVLKK